MSTLSSDRQSPEPAEIRLYECSIDSARNIFQRLQEEHGILNKLESHILNKLYETLQITKPVPSGVIYLKVSYKPIFLLFFASSSYYFEFFARHSG